MPCRTWHLATGQCTQLLQGHAGRLNAVKLSGSGTTAITGKGLSVAMPWSATRQLSALGNHLPMLERQSDTILPRQLTRQLTLSWLLCSSRGLPLAMLACAAWQLMPHSRSTAWPVMLATVTR